MTQVPRGSRPYAFIIMCGSIGSGKTTLARHLATKLRATRISSDRIRKNMAGVLEHQSLDERFYSMDWTDRVYQAMVEEAKTVSDKGQLAILDATFANRKLRKYVADFEHTILVWVQAPKEVVRRRLCARQKQRSESDAGPELLESSLQWFEKPDWSRMVSVDSSQQNWMSEALKAVNHFLSHDS